MSITKIKTCLAAIALLTTSAGAFAFTTAPSEDDWAPEFRTVISAKTGDEVPLIRIYMDSEIALYDVYQKSLRRQPDDGMCPGDPVACQLDRKRK